MIGRNRFSFQFRSFLFSFLFDSIAFYVCPSLLDAQPLPNDKESIHPMLVHFFGWQKPTSRSTTKEKSKLLLSVCACVCVKKGEGEGALSSASEGELLFIWFVVIIERNSK